MIRNNLEHPFHPPRKIYNQAPIQPSIAQKFIPSSPARMQPSSSAHQIQQSQPRITFSSGSLPPPKAEPVRVTEPVFREMRERYARTPSATVVEIKSNDKQKV